MSPSGRSLEVRGHNFWRLPGLDRQRMFAARTGPDFPGRPGPGHPPWRGGRAARGVVDPSDSLPLCSWRILQSELRRIASILPGNETTSKAWPDRQAHARATETQMSICSTYQSPIGGLELFSNGEALEGLLFDDSRKVERWRAQAQAGSDAILDRTCRQLDGFFAGRRQEFDVPLAPAGTSFQLRVWKALLRVHYGETATYGTIAAHIRRPTASRAVGLANGSNPIAILIPCHRIIGANGSLTGYGGGLDCKRFLLALEQGQGQIVARAASASSGSR